MENIISFTPPSQTTLFSLPNLQELSLAFEDTQAELMGAQASYAEASDDLNHAKFELEAAKAKVVAEGVEGKNSEQREANLRLALSDLYERVATAEFNLSTKRLAFDLSKYEWDSLRYKLRAFEIATRLTDLGLVG